MNAIPRMPLLFSTVLFLPAATSLALDDVAGASRVVLFEDFEDQEPGDLARPWTVTRSGVGSASVIRTLDTDHGQVLRLRGGTEAGDFLVATRHFTSTARSLKTEFMIKPGLRSAFVMSVHGTGATFGRRGIRLFQAPGTGILSATAAPFGTFPCGTLQAYEWSTIELTIHADSQTYDIAVNGHDTSCMGLEMRLETPYTAIKFLDAGAEGWGRTVQIDDIVITSE